ncbi:MAG: DinB family protein [Flavisolibacter sp.]
MALSSEIAKTVRSLYQGGNYTGVNFKETLANIDWQQARKKVQSFNTIAALVYHINYYVVAVSNVLRGEPLNASDQYSFDHPTVESAEDWERLLNRFWTDGEEFAKLVERFPEDKFSEPFLDGKYGSSYRNIAGVIEHAHYHLGQIVLVKKLV